MSKKTILFSASIIFLSSFHLAYASLLINEIMYDLSGSDSAGSKSREWIEIYNPDASDAAIDASKWRIFDGSANRTINNEADFSIPSNSYVIFAGDKATFLADYPGFTGTVYETGITSLNNTGATLKLLDQDLNQVDSATYSSSQGGAGDGNSLQLINGSWTSASPTPGMVNQLSVAPSQPVTDNQPASTSSSSSFGTGIIFSNGANNTTTSSKTSTTQNTTATESKIKAQITGPSLGFVGLPLTFKGIAYGHQGERLLTGKYFWNFGDGDAKEMQVIESQDFTHKYFYPGDYTASFTYYSNPYSDISDASDQIKIKIVPMDILISRVGDEKDFFVEIANNTDYDADISNWILLSGGKSFTIPENSILGSKKTIVISPKITNFSIADKNTLKLLTPQREVAFDYSSVAISVPTPILPNPDLPSGPLQNISPAQIPVSETKKVTNAKNNNSPQNKISISGTESLSVPSEKLADTLIASQSGTASVVSSNIANNDSAGNPYATTIPIVAIAFIGASAGAVYFIRRRRVIPQAGSEFEILDE